MDWSIVVTAILAIIALFCRIKWIQLKSAFKETAEAMMATSAALADDKITSEEVVNLLKEWSECVVAGKKLFSKE